jgi:hypothetical protein
VSAEALAACKTLLGVGTHALPIGDCDLRVTRNTRDEFAAEVWRDVLIATIWVCRDRASLQRVLTETGAPASDLSTPVCLARLEAGSLQHQDTLDWLADFERCLAWAFLEQHDDR